MTNSTVTEEEKAAHVHRRALDGEYDDCYGEQAATCKMANSTVTEEEEKAAHVHRRALDGEYDDCYGEQAATAWTGASEEVRVGCYGEALIARRGYTVRMPLEDCIQISAFLRHNTLAIFIEMTVHVSGRLDIGSFTADAQRVFYTENAGGSSELSEAFSMELLARCAEVTLHKTELELEYFTGNGSATKITDYSMALLDDTIVGVSVTRACNGQWPHISGSYSVEDAARLLAKKLFGVNESSRHISNASWSKQLLFIFVAHPTQIPILREAACRLTPELIANTVVLFALCTGDDAASIFNRSSPLKKRTRLGLGRKSAEHLRFLRESEPCARQWLFR
ncbi:hypothetical protein T492DRAFT_985911 [Pavlovales sp. CCMP2436]|nr:hypothetical protein T492DRAFT_985911 [Pavlovales sp. CCMP2436]